MSWRQPTGTFCRRGHPQFIEIRMVEVRGVKQNHGQVGPSCFVDGVRRTRSSSATSNGEKGEHRLFEGGGQIGPSVSSATFR